MVSRRAPKARHDSDLTPPLQRGTVHRHEQIEQHNKGHDGQDHLQHLFRETEQVEDAEEH